ncbi:MAG: hypothetical protein GY873_03690 [Bosea sp.]|uniref:hypothetical protein n=1 Tax=Bosea sp. (in: a-proteobacteria) TaxID=1871050 RepID=UPI00239E4048|nr:hypothetical protein [Bosea sp. (in: a-proteobacteria)]
MTGIRAVERALRRLAVLVLSVLAVPALAQSPSVPADRSIAEAQGLKLEYQAGKTGFPTEAFAYSKEEPSARKRLLQGKSTVVALIDQVPYSAKSHVTVRYGANIFEARTGPIAIGSTYLQPYGDTIVFGADAFPVPVRSDAFLLQFGGTGDLPAFGVLLKRREAPPLGFVHNLPEDDLRRVVQANVLALSQVDPLLSAKDAPTLAIKTLESASPAGTDRSFRIDLAGDGAAPIEAAYLVLKPKGREPVVLDYAGFVRDRVTPSMIALHAIGAPDDGGVTLELRDQRGVTTTVYPDGNGNFVFARPQGAIFSATFRTMNEVFYAPPGRWLAAEQDVDAEIVLRPDYVNPGGQLNDLDACRRSIRRSRLQTLYTEFYAPHTRAWWSGAANKMTRFFNQYFHNNIGFHDIDVLQQNKEQCRVGMYLGESLVEARQVRLFERSATLISERLSLALQRCVLVHTMAPGKTIQSYEDILRIQRDLKPDFLMFELSPSIFMYMTPEFQRRFFGYSEGQSPVSAFKLDEKGTLQYLPPSPKWMEHTVPPNPILGSGGQIGTAFLLPEKDAPPEANTAWSVLEAIIRQYNKEFPDTLIVLEGLYERARCAAQEGCAPRQLPSVTTSSPVSAGPSVFEQRLTDLCGKVKAVCSVGKPGDEESVFRRSMIYENDFHFTEYGNYWLAEQVARDLAAPLARQPGPPAAGSAPAAKP